MVNQLETIQRDKLYRGQIRAMLAVGAGQVGGPLIGEGRALDDLDSWAARIFLEEIGIQKLSTGQHDGIAAALDGASAISLSGPGGAGLTLAGLAASVAMVADRFMDVLCVAPCRETLARWEREYAVAFAALEITAGLTDIHFSDHIPDLNQDLRKTRGRLILTSMEEFLDRIEQSPGLGWLSAYGFVFLDSVDERLQQPGLHSTTALANALAATRALNPCQQTCVTCARFEDNARYVSDLLGVGSIEMIECDSREGEKTFLLWGSPLDREKFGGEIKPGRFFDDLVDLCTLVVRAGHQQVLLYDSTGMFCRSERDVLIQQVTDRVETASIRFCRSVAEFCDPQRHPSEPEDEDSGEPARVCLGLQMPLGMLRDRLRGVSAPDAYVILVEGRTPVSGLHRYAMARKQVGVSHGLPPECRFLENALQIGFQKGLCCIDSVQALQNRQKHLQAFQGQWLTEHEMVWSRYAWRDLKAARLPARLQSVCRDTWAPLDASWKTVEETQGASTEGAGLIPTDYYPGSIVTVQDRRYQVIQPGTDLRRPWHDVELQPAADLDRQTSRLFTVAFTAEHTAQPISLVPQNTLFPGATYGCQTAAIAETVTGLEMIGRFSLDLLPGGGNIAPITYPTWKSRLLLIKPARELSLGAEGLVTLAALLPDAIALRIVMPKYALTCVLLDENGCMCRDQSQTPVALALYARDPLDHATIDVLGTSGVLQDVFRLALAILLACPCPDGCACCINTTRLPSGLRDHLNKDGLTRLLSDLLGYSEGVKIADDRHQMRALERIVDRVRDIIVPYQVSSQLGLELPVPVTLRHLAGRVAANNPGALGLFTGDAVYVRPEQDESTYIGLLAHEYMHQWQRDFLDPDLEVANGDNIEDPDNVLFPVYALGSWKCRGYLYVEGGAEWLKFRVADAFNLKSTMAYTSDGQRGNEYGEGFQHMLWLERKHGTHTMLQMLNKEKPEHSVYKGFEEHTNPKTALYEASLLYAALSDSSLDIVDEGGLACCETRGDWPFYTRASHYRSQYRQSGGCLPPLDVTEEAPETVNPGKHRKTQEELASELLDVSIGACIDAQPAAASVLKDLGLHCASCPCSHSDRPCSLRTAAYMHSNASTSARELGESLAAKISGVLLAKAQSERDAD